MKILSFLAFTLVVVSACTKKDIETPHPPPADEFPEMLVTELNDAEVKYRQYQSIDLNKDGIRDIVFATWLIGDPLEMEDELLFFASANTQSALMVGDENDSPRFNKNDVIPIKALGGYEWYVVAMAEMARKNTGYVRPPYWELDWQNANHLFLAVQVRKGKNVYYGWVEVSMDTANSKMILHRAAISKQPGRKVKAGI